MEKRCGDDGKWEGRNGTQDSPLGWTNYTPCYTSETWFLLRKIYTGNKDAAEVKQKMLMHHSKYFLIILDCIYICI